MEELRTNTMLDFAQREEEEKPLLSIEQKMEAFLRYLELDNYDMLRYHMQACGKLMDEAPLVRHVTREGGHMHDGHIHVGNPSEDERNLYLRPTVDRAGNLYRKRKLAKKTIKIQEDSIHKYLKRAYLLYSTGRHKRGRGDPYMEKCGFLNLLRDCQLLDNKSTLLDLADFVDKELEGRTELQQGANGSGSNNGHESSSQHYNAKPLTMEDVDHLLRKTAVLKYPELDPEEALLKLYEIHVVPFIKQSNGADEVLVQLFNDQVLAVVKRHAKALKKVYSHYATLSLVSFHHSHWKAVRRANRAMTLDEYVTFMLNFEVAPTLFNHHDIEELFDKSNQNQQFNEDRLVWMNFSQFIESILRSGIRVVNSLESKISNKSATITELNSFKKFVSLLPTEESKEHYTNVLALRRKAVHDKIVMTQQNSQLEFEASNISGVANERSRDDTMRRSGGGSKSPSNVQKDANSGEFVRLPSNGSGSFMNTVWSEFEDEEKEQRALLVKKQETLNVNFKTLKQYIQQDLAEAPKNEETMGEVVDQLDVDIGEFEERLARSPWKKPKDEMKGWKTGFWKDGIRNTTSS